MKQLFKLGAKLGIKDPRNLRLSNYLRPELPDPPLFLDWITGHESALAMRHNDTLGLCVEAALWNALSVAASNTGNAFVDDPDGAEKDYEAIT